MKNIRNKVFETNSSSSHSISIYNATKGLYDTITPNASGVIELVGGEFGWEWERYNDAETKANYAAVFSQSNQQFRDMLEQVIKEHTGAKEVVFNVGGYIDHQSDYSEGGDAMKAFDTPLTLKNFIFHPESWLFTGNDNDSEPSNFYDVGFGILYSHQLEIDGCSTTEKFQDEPGEELLKDAIDRVIRYHPLLSRGNYNYEDRWSLVSWDRKAHDGKTFSSFDKLNLGIITLFKTKSVYAKEKKGGGYLGEEVLDSTEVKFEIKKLIN